MGYFSELNAQEGQGAEKHEVLPFSLEGSGDDAPPEKAEFDDDAMQQAEADAAPAELEKLSQSEPPAPTEEEKRKAHEEAEEKRKAEWDARQAAKKEARDKALRELEGMGDDEAVMASVKRVGADTERLTRRNMKDCVTEHIQTKCLDDPAFARRTMNPSKNMINCFKYITRHALNYIKQELADNGEPNLGFGMGSDVPDDLCYQWAVDYFLDDDAEEDKEKEEEFVPKPYRGSTTTPTKKRKNPTKKEPADKKPVTAPAPAEQITLLDQIGLDEADAQKTSDVPAESEGESVV